MNTEIKLRKNGHKHGGGWNDNTPRKPLSEKNGCRNCISKTQTHARCRKSFKK